MVRIILLSCCAEITKRTSCISHSKSMESLLGGKDVMKHPPQECLFLRGKTMQVGQGPRHFSINLWVLQLSSAWLQGIGVVLICEVGDVVLQEDLVPLPDRHGGDLQQDLFSDHLYVGEKLTSGYSS